MSKVLNITNISPKESYDITVEGTHEYYASTKGNFVLSHNCKEFIIYDLLGPIFYDNKVEKLRPRIETVVMPGIGKLPQSWTYMVSKLEKSPERLKVIAKEAVKDVKNGHSVIIALNRTVAIKTLTAAINRMAKEEIAVAFYGGTKDRKAMIQDLRAYRKKVVVGTAKLMTKGINIPRASMFYQCSPSSNMPNAEQRFSRVLTPFKGKPDPVFKYFLDDAPVVKSCMVKEHWQCVMPTFRPQVSKTVNAQLAQYFKRSQQGERMYSHSGGVI